MSNARHISLSVLLLLSTVTFSNAQSGHGDIEGTVTDASTGQALVGVNVTIEGTSIGVAADLDGHFVLRRVPSGNRVLVFSYIGYETSRTPVEVRAGERLEVDTALAEERLVGDEVTISAQRQGQQQAINRQITSDHIVNVVSEARLQELPDFNAAAALSRLPGISTQKSSGEDNKVVIRGLSPKYNAVEIEGVRLSATGSTQIGLSSNPNQGNPTVNNDRSVDLTTVSPYMIRMISLYKALTPDMNANSIGGTVNMELREAPPGPRGSLLLQGGYTAKSSTYGNYRAIASGSNRFLNDKLGAYVFLVSESYDRDADNLDADYGIRADAVEQDPGTGFRPVQANEVTFNRHLETRKRYGANLILDYNLPSGSLKSINMYTRLNSDYTDHRQTIEYDTGRMTWNLRLGESAIDQRLHSLKLDYDLRFISADLTASYSSSGNVLDGSPSLNFNQVDALQAGVPRDNVVPEDLTYLIDFRGNDQVVLRSADLFSSDYEEEKYTFKADFEVPFNVGTGLTGFFKFGGQYDDQSNAIDQETPYLSFGQGGNEGIQGNMMRAIEEQFGYSINAQGDLAGSLFLNSDGDLFDPFLSDRFGDVYYSATPNQLTEILDYIIGNPDFDASNTEQSSGAQGGWYDGPYQQLTNDYEYGEDYQAAYAMSRVNFRDLMIIGGARYEKVNSDYFAYNARDQRNAQAQRMYDTTAVTSNDYLLPMGQMRYSPLKWLDLRYAYTQTLARPDYHQLSPKFTITQDNRVYTGNPDLKPARAYNHDVSVTFHGNKLGLLSAGAFHKKIDGFVYDAVYQLDAAQRAGVDSLARYTIIRDGNPVVIPQSNAQVQRPLNNPNEATVKGLEFEFQTSFWYLPNFLSNIVFGLNYTYVESETTYPFYDIDVLPGRPPIAVLVDSSRTGRLLDQANDIVNTFVGYDYKGFSARLSFTFQGNAVNEIGSEFPERDGFTRDYFRLDFAARQKLPVANGELFLDVQNLNDENTESAQRTIGGFNAIQNYGTTANLGVRLTL